MRGHLHARLLILALAVSACPGCVDETAEYGDTLTPEMVSRGIITASFNRYIENGNDEPYETFGLTGVFARSAPERTGTVDMLWDQIPEAVDLALDSCTIPSPVLDKSRDQDPLSDRTIELLDVGDLTVAFAGVIKPVPTRTFPDLLKLIVGVTYAADDTQGVLFQPGATYDIRATGTGSMVDFRVALDAPEDLGRVTLDGISPEDGSPVVTRGQNVELTWDGDGYGDEVYVNLSWTSMGTPWQITCRVRDDGQFVIPATITTGLPDPITSTDEEMSIQRVRQVAFRSKDLSSGSFKFIVSTNFSVRF